MFNRWLDEGYYDFCNVPFCFKTQLSKADRNFIEKDIKEMSRNASDLLKEVKEVIKTLRLSENDIIKKGLNLSRVSAIILLPMIYNIWSL